MNVPIQNEKRRHGCLITYLILIILASSGTALLYLLASDLIRETQPNMPDWAFPVLIANSVLNLLWTIALFRWKKWGFWGFVVSAVISISVNLSIDLSVLSALGGLVGVAVLFGVLQIGKEKKGWSQLD